jgi:phage tail-like protein
MGAWPVAAAPVPVALTATEEAVYLGDAGGTIARYRPDGTLMSTLPSAVPGLAALARGCDGELLAGPGTLPLYRFRLDGGFTPAGNFLAGPFLSRARPLAWQRWRVLAEAPAPGAHLQLFTYCSAATYDPPHADGDNPFTDPAWYAGPRDETDVLVLSRPVRDTLAAGPPAEDAPGVDENAVETSYFWLGGLLRGDGTASPTVHQMRLDFMPSTYLRYLPAIFRNGVERRLFLELALAEVASEVEHIGELIDTLPARFDPAATPANWLPWLAGWLDFDLSGDWSEAETRRNIAGAMALYARRGTVSGLRRYLELYAGVTARIEEPIESAGLFVLGDDAALGFNTQLAPGPEQGAVLGTTATLGDSHLIAANEAGVPLFADVAHRFCVQLYAAQLAEPRTRELVVQVLEREKPAHTEYHLCPIEPRMRVGAQARVGVDSIVGGPRPVVPLGEQAELGVDMVLADQPPRSRRLGQGLRVGSVL